MCIALEFYHKNPNDFDQAGVCISHAIFKLKQIQA